jgi:hypothetical protein
MMNKELEVNHLSDTGQLRVTILIKKTQAGGLLLVSHSPQPIRDVSDTPIIV